MAHNIQHFLVITNNVKNIVYVFIPISYFELSRFISFRKKLNVSCVYACYQILFQT